jgi:hypothetical protein
MSPEPEGAMSFKVKDLMITVLPAGSPIGWPGPGNICDNNLCTKACTRCTETCSYCSCTQCTDGCTHSAKDFGDIVNPADLALLKERLKIALAEVEARERVIEESLRPKTLADVELLEQKLSAALEEVRTQKAALLKTSTQK